MIYCFGRFIHFIESQQLLSGPECADWRAVGRGMGVTDYRHDDVHQQRKGYENATQEKDWQVNSQETWTNVNVRVETSDDFYCDDFR